MHPGPKPEVEVEGGDPGTFEGLSQRQNYSFVPRHGKMGKAHMPQKWVRASLLQNIFKNEHVFRILGNAKLSK